jgi:pentatricopeptide repeat protein
MDMYGKCGKMYEMPHLMPGRVKGPRQSWNILISGYARHGHFNKAEESFKEMAPLKVQSPFGCERLHSGVRN